MGPVRNSYNNLFNLGLINEKGSVSGFGLKFKYNANFELQKFDLQALKLLQNFAYATTA